MAAGVRRITVEVPITGVVENILQGSPLEYPGMASSIEIFSSVIAAGAGTVTMDVLIGTDLIAESVILPIEFAAGEGPRVPDHQLVVDAVAPGDHVQIRMRNSGGTARTCTTLVRIQPV